jgi:hypothetical protein
MMDRTTIPQKLYVTFQYRTDLASGAVPLAFASPYTADAAFEKRKITQDHWAYGRGISVDIQADESVSVTGTGSGTNAHWDAGVLFISNCFPRILKNQALEGFEISRSVRRYGWSGKGNVVWRITDPRGFDLEITSENFASIIDCADLEKGVIRGPCIWGRLGPKNVLLPENSVPYQEAVRRTEKVNQKVSLREVQRGDIIDIISSSVPEQHQRCRYFGKLIAASTDADADPGISHIQNQRILLGRQQECHVIQSQLDGSLFKLSSIRISAVLDRSASPLSAEQAAQEVNDAIAKNGPTDWCDLVLPKKTPRDQLKFSLVPVQDLHLETWPRCRSHHFNNYLAKDSQGQMFLASRGGYHNSRSCRLHPVTWDAVSGKLVLAVVPQPRTMSCWQTAPTHRLVKTEIQSLEGLEFFEFGVQLPGEPDRVIKNLGYYW